MDVTYFQWLSITSVPNLYGEGLAYGSSAKRSSAKGVHLVFRSEIVNNCYKKMGDPNIFIHPIKKRNMVAYEIFFKRSYVYIGTKLITRSKHKWNC